MQETDMPFLVPVRNLEPYVVSGRQDYLHVAAAGGRLSLRHMPKATPSPSVFVEECARVNVGDKGKAIGSPIIMKNNGLYNARPDTHMLATLQHFTATLGFDWVYRALQKGEEVPDVADAVGLFHLSRPDQKVSVQSAGLERPHTFKRVPTFSLLRAGVCALIFERTGL